MSQFFQSVATLLQAQFLPPTTAPQLMLERLYYAEDATTHSTHAMAASKGYPG